MKANLEKGYCGLRFRQFTNSSYAAFASLKKEVTIGVLAVSTLTFANVEVASAQNVIPQTADKLFELDEVEVTGSRVPSTLGQAARMVTVLDKEAIAAAPAQSVNDLLKYAASIDVRQRGPLGVQTDISVRGGTSEQITILLNGINICDPQTGHNTADFPVDISEIERIEILEGPAGRVYGTSSLVGAINIVTKTEEKTSADAYLKGGSYGYYSAGLRTNIVSGKFNNQLSGGYAHSDGYSRSKSGRLNSDFSNVRLFYQGVFNSEDADVMVNAGYSSKDFGSNTFWSVKYDNQFEHTEKYHLSLQAETKGFFHFKPSVYWRRNIDRFEMVRGNEDKIPFNYHRTDVYGLNMNGYFSWFLGKTAFGAEFRNEDIVSGNLGEPLNKPKHIKGTDRDYIKGLNRSNLSFHLEHNILINRLTLSAGMIVVKNTWNEMNFHVYPGADASFQLSRNIKAYASFNTSLRMPSFTDLYYSVEGYKADKFLKPEEMSAYEVGLKYLSGIARATVSVYNHRGKNMIDWIRDNREGEDAKWQSVNHTKIKSFGVETSFTLNLNKVFPSQKLFNSLNLSYGYINQDKDIENYIQSKYALEYLKHKLVASVDINILKNLSLTTIYRWQERVGNYQKTDGTLESYGSFGILDSRIVWKNKMFDINVEADNIFNKIYHDYGNIPQPGFWLTAGIALHI